MKPGDFALHSVRSRVAVRKMLEARKATEVEELRFLVKSIVDDSPINLGALVEHTRKGD